jgi:regulator of protease activity HflC (stomatin/prohibitin superfamily)
MELIDHISMEYCRVIETSEPPNCITSVYNNISSCSGSIISCICIPFVCLGPLKVIPQGYKGVLLRFGIFIRVLNPGRYNYNICTDEIILISTKTKVIQISTQKIMTGDNLSVVIDAVCFFNIYNVRDVLFNVENYAESIENLSKTVLRTVVGENDLKSLFSDRTNINLRMTSLMTDRTRHWGIDNITVDIKDVSIPLDLQRVMAKTAEVKQDSLSKSIAAEGEKNAVEILAEASALIKNNPEAMELLWFNTIKDISKEKSNTIIVPNSIISKFLNFKE